MDIARKPPGEPPTKKPATRAKPAGAPARPRATPRPKANLALAAKAPGTPRKKTIAAGPAAPKAPRVRRAKLEPSRLDAIQATIVASLDDDKAENILCLDLIGRASFADRMVIATGIADRQISAMATHLEDKLHEAGIRRVQIEGAGGSDWVLIDAGDIVVHLFKPEARELYGLERMWGPSALDDAPADPPD